jgi:murein DD-endopeptidase MepM/ murein hydrolase activator NlpD
MDYTYVAGVEALLLNNQRRRTSMLNLSLLAGAVLLAGTCITQYQSNKTIRLATANSTFESARAEIITAAAASNTPVLASIGQPTAKPLPVATIPSVPPAEPVQLAAADQTTVAPEQPVQPPKPAEPEWKIVTVRKGDTLAKVFNRLGLKTELAKSNSGLKKATQRLAQLKPASQLKILVDGTQNIQEIVYPMNDLETLKVIRKGKGFQSEVIRQKTTTKLANIGGTIDQSLMSTAQKQGLDKKQVTQLANIFKDKLNVNTLRRGDHVNVLVQQEYVGDKKVSTGNIMAAQVTSRGKTLSAVRYADVRGNVEYYTPEGQSLRKGFTRIPLQNYTYVSSPFAQSRLHPVSGQYKRHPAVDFAAPTGTPIKSAGAGRIVFVGSKGAYGKTVMIEHHNNISTLYAHMNGFNREIHRGMQVQEGQVIGYVGSTGITTGSHLHYELRIAGVHRNPLTIDLPTAAPLPKSAMARFAPQARRLLAQMDPIPQQRTRLVSKTTPAATKPKTKRI